MSLNKKPYIFMKFRRLEFETEKAYLLIDKDHKEVWMPKSICRLQKVSDRGVTALIAPFKYEEMTGNEIQLLTADLKWRQPVVREPPITIIQHKDFELLPEQLKACKFLLGQQKSALFAETRTGKTIITLTAVKSRQEAGVVDKLVVICPVRLEKQWQRYCEKFGINDFYIFGIQNFSCESLRYKKSRELREILTEKTQLIIDESHLFKNVGAYRTPILTEAISCDCYKIIMTGTPIGKHMGDLYSQFELLDKSILNYSSYGEFERTHLLYGGREGKKVVGYVNIEEFAYSLEPYIYRLTREQVLQDRKIKYKKIPFLLTQEEQEEYLDCLRKMSGFANGNSILGNMVKLQMLTSVSQNRIKALDGLVSGKVVIFYKFDIEAQKLQDWYNFPVLSGKTGKKDFDKFIQEFNQNKVAGLIVNQSLATGFDLGSAEKVIFYSSLFDIIAKTQASDRAMSMFNNTELEYFEIYAEETIDAQILKVIEKKENIKTAFYNEIKRLEELEVKNEKNRKL